MLNLGAWAWRGSHWYPVSLDMGPQQRVQHGLRARDLLHLGLVHWADPEGWYGEGGGRRVQDPGLPHCRQMLYHLSHQGSTWWYYCGSGDPSIALSTKGLVKPPQLHAREKVVTRGANPSLERPLPTPSQVSEEAQGALGGPTPGDIHKPSKVPLTGQKASHLLMPPHTV